MQNEMEMKVIKIKTLNPHITCAICNGYFVKPVTIMECLHTFCKSCIVKYLENEDSCPTCKVLIHHSQPLKYIKFDRIMKNIVNVLVPELEENEKKAEIEFNCLKNIPMPKVMSPNENIADTCSNSEENTPEKRNIVDTCSDNEKSTYTEAQLYDQILSDQMNITLESTPSDSLNALERKYIRTSCKTTIAHVKKFIAVNLLNDINKYKNVDILHNTQLLDEDYTLGFICDTRQRRKQSPLCLRYQSAV